MSKIRDDYPDQLGKAFDISHPDGWDKIVRALLDKVAASGKDVTFCQIKSKFGGLRAYDNGCDDEVREWIRQAEAECWKTCEECGASAKVRPGGWIVTMCDECFAKREAAKKKAK